MGAVTVVIFESVGQRVRKERLKILMIVSWSPLILKSIMKMQFLFSIAGLSEIDRFPR